EHAMAASNTPWSHRTRHGRIEHAMAASNTPWPHRTRHGRIEHAMAASNTPWSHRTRHGRDRALHGPDRARHARDRARRATRGRWPPHGHPPTPKSLPTAAHGGPALRSPLVGCAFRATRGRTRFSLENWWREQGSRTLDLGDAVVAALRSVRLRPE